VLHWQLLKWLKGLSLGAKIILASIVGHLGVLFSLFVLYKGSSPYKVVVTSTMINTDVPILFMPLHKSLNKSGGGQKQQGGAQKNVNPTCTTNTQASTVTTPVKEKAKTIIAESALSKKQKNKKGKNKKQIKKETSKKVAPKKKAELEKKEEPIKPVQEPIKQPVEEAKPVEQSVQPQNLSANSDAPVSEGDNVLYVGQQEMEALQMQDYIQQEMAQHWSPPFGMRKDLMCIVKVVVAFDGTLASIDFEQASGVLLFDGAAKKAVSQLQPPRWAYGKELSITFKP
jgi:hypothetical protein